MHVHLGRDEWPYYCELCNFKSRKYSELIDHVTVYTRHIAKANKEKIVDNRPFLKQNPNPHVFGPSDFKALTPEGSLLHFMGLAGQEGTREGDMEPSQPSTQAAMAQPSLQSTPLLRSAPNMKSPVPASSQPLDLTVPVSVAPHITPSQIGLGLGQPWPGAVRGNQLLQTVPAQQTSDMPTLSPILPVQTAVPGFSTQQALPIQSPIIRQNTSSGSLVSELGPSVMNTPQLSLAEQLTAVFNSIANIVRKPSDSAQEDRAGVNVSDTIIPESKQSESAAEVGNSTVALKTNLNLSNVQKIAEKETFIIEEGYGLEREEVPEYIPTPIKGAETKSKANDKGEKN